MSMTPNKRVRRTREQKLRDAVATAHQQLLESKSDVVYPQDRQGHLFHAYSRALRVLVAYHLKSLGAFGWGIAEDDDVSWRWDGEAAFYFDYEAYVELPRPGDTYHAAPQMRCLARLRFDPEQPLDAELARVAGEARHYRECVALMERGVTARAQGSAT